MYRQKWGTQNESWQFDGADLAIANGSGIRADIPKGGISLNSILTVLPYGTKLDLVEVTGQQVLDALEWSVHSMPEEFGGFEQVSGVTFEVDPDIKSPCVEDSEKMFVRVDETKPRRVKNVRIGDQELVPDETYKLVTNDYILMDGDGFLKKRKGVCYGEYEKKKSYKDVRTGVCFICGGNNFNHEYHDIPDPDKNLS